MFTNCVFVCIRGKKAEEEKNHQEHCILPSEGLQMPSAFHNTPTPTHDQNENTKLRTQRSSGRMSVM